jgi:hypothetical protein
MCIEVSQSDYGGMAVISLEKQNAIKGGRERQTGHMNAILPLTTARLVPYRERKQSKADSRFGEGWRGKCSTPSDHSFSPAPKAETRRH